MVERQTRPRAGTSSIPSEEICPHLGIEEDPQTCLAYPSYWNLCHHSRPASVVRLGHQRKTCLLPAHTACPVFQSKLIAPLPAELRVRSGKSMKAPSRKPGSA
jgi:hypothetical protein